MDPFEEAFPFVEAEHRDLLRAASTRRDYEPGDVILEEGTTFAGLYVIESGSVSVQKSHLGGGIPLAELGPGALFGEVSYLDGSPLSASVVARTGVTAYVIEDPDKVIASDPAVAAGLYRSLAVVLAGRLRFGNEERVISGLQWA